MSLKLSFVLRRRQKLSFIVGWAVKKMGPEGEVSPWTPLPHGTVTLTSSNAMVNATSSIPSNRPPIRTPSTRRVSLNVNTLAPLIRRSRLPTAFRMSVKRIHTFCPNGGMMLKFREGSAPRWNTPSPAPIYNSVIGPVVQINSTCILPICWVHVAIRTQLSYVNALVHIRRSRSRKQRCPG